MKKLIVLLTALLILPACSAPEPEAVETPAVTIYSEPAWFDNDYTAGLPVPPGEASWAALDETNGLFAVSFDGVDDSEFDSYMQELDSAGFDLLADTSGDVEGQDYTFIGGVYYDGERYVSISRIPDTLAVSVSFYDDLLE